MGFCFLKAFQQWILFYGGSYKFNHVTHVNLVTLLKKSYNVCTLQLTKLSN